MAPTLYCRLFESDPELAKNVYILEYDKRFSVYDNFAFYDVHDPLDGGIKKLPAHSFDFILADPPFWLEDVLTKLFSTIDYLSASNGAKEHGGSYLTSFLINVLLTCNRTPVDVSIYF